MEKMPALEIVNWEKSWNQMYLLTYDHPYAKIKKEKFLLIMKIKALSFVCRWKGPDEAITFPTAVVEHLVMGCVNTATTSTHSSAAASVQGCNS